jgi:hypothetical protein
MRYTPATMPHEDSPTHRTIRTLAGLIPLMAALIVATGMMSGVADAQVSVKAVARPGAAPPWDKGMIAINAESYYHAIECGKQGGEDPACVFWDTGLCKNDDFTLAFYSAYKQVAYEVWAAVRKKKPAPQPSYQAAQRTRITIGISPVAGSKNALTDFIVKRGGKPVQPAVRTVSGGTGNVTFDYAAFAPTATVTIEMIGKTRTLSCSISPEVLRQFR